VTLNGVEPVNGGQPGARRTINGLSTSGETSVTPRSARGRGGTRGSTSGKGTSIVARGGITKTTGTRQSTLVAIRRATVAVAATDTAQQENTAP